MIKPCKCCGNSFDAPYGGTRFCSLDCHFENYVVRNENGCWGWAGVHSKSGYGKMSRGRNNPTHAHRYSYEKHIGQIPDGLFVLHKCDNPPCTNPAHLFVGTNRDNMHDAMRKGRNRPPPIQRGMDNILVRNPLLRPMGAKHHSAKLTEQQVLEIAKSEEQGSVLAKAFGVSPTLISNIRRRRIWKHLLAPDLVGKPTR